MQIKLFLVARNEIKQTAKTKAPKRVNRLLGEESRAKGAGTALGDCSGSMARGLNFLKKDPRGLNQSIPFTASQLDANTSKRSLGIEDFAAWKNRSDNKMASSSGDLA